MRTLSLFSALLLGSLSLFAQPKKVPQKISVPKVSSDPNQSFNVLHFEAGEKPGTYKVLYYQPLDASVITDGEFFQDTGFTIFSDARFTKPVGYSGQALLLVKQAIDAEGNATTENVHVLAKRKFESAGNYTLWFKPKFKHPVINTGIPVKHTVYNLDGITGLTPGEYEALSIMVRREYVPEYYVDRGGNRFEPTLAEELRKLRSDLKYLGQTGLNFKGDIPSTEKVLSRFTVSDKQNLVVSQDKAASELKFYLTTDFTKMELMGSTSYEGELQLSAISAVYDENLNIAGAFGVAQTKFKGADKKDVQSLISFVLTADNDILTWKHSVGASKLSSLTPELCWFEGGKVHVLSTNAEKFFKQFHQVHVFEKDKEPVMTFPLSDEEKALDKFAYTKTFQPEAPAGTTGAGPLPTARIPYLMKKIGSTTYFVIQSYSKDYNTNVESYLGLDVYKLNSEGKFLGITSLNGYQTGEPVPTAELLNTPDQLDLLVSYPVKYQLELTAANPEVIQVESPTMQLVQLQNGNYQSKTSTGTVLLGRNPMGTGYTLFVY